MERTQTLEFIMPHSSSKNKWSASSVTFCVIAVTLSAAIIAFASVNRISYDSEPRDVTVKSIATKQEPPIPAATPLSSIQGFSPSVVSTDTCELQYWFENRSDAPITVKVNVDGIIDEISTPAGEQLRETPFLPAAPKRISITGPQDQLLLDYYPDYVGCPAFMTQYSNTESNPIAEVLPPGAPTS